MSNICVDNPALAIILNPMKTLRRSVRLILISSLAALALALSPACGGGKKSTGKLVVVATIPPLADWAREVGGERVEVKTLLSPGASPHTFEPLPSQAEDVSRAGLVVSVGLDVDRWLDGMLTANNRLLVSSRLGGVELITGEDSDLHGEEANPHIWLDPEIAKLVVHAIADSLSAIDPQGADAYKSNASRYAARLDSLDREIEKITSAFPKKEYVSFHPAWAYFDRRYGLRTVAVVIPSPGKEPSPRHLEAVVAEIRKTNVKAVFTEPQFSPKAAEVIAREAGVKVLTIDPIGNRDRSYIDLMRADVGVMSSVLGAK